MSASVSSSLSLNSHTLTQQAGNSKKRKKWGVTDPAEIAPNYYHEDLFKANFPLVDVVKVSASIPFPVKDKFEGGVLDSRVTEAARREWSRGLVEVAQTYKRPNNEKQAFPFHLALLEQVRRFTLPAEPRIEQVRESRVGRKRKWGMVVGHDDEEERFAGFSIEAEMEDVQGMLGRGDPDETSTILTGDLTEHEDIPTGFADSVLRVHDYRPRQRAKTAAEAAGIQTERVAGVLVRKFAEDETKNRAVWQGAYYSVKYAELNIQNGHGTPLTVLVETSHSWTYALLVPEGYVELKNGNIDPASEPAFERHRKLCMGSSSMENRGDKLEEAGSSSTPKKLGDNLEEAGSSSTLKKLGRKLEEATSERYRPYFRDNPTACYRDGPQLVGTLYVRDDWYSLPNTQDFGFANRGARRLFDGLLRLVLGDAVLKMSNADLMGRVRLNQEMTDILNESLHWDEEGEGEEE